MPQRRFPRPWRFEAIPGGYRVIDANHVALAHVYGEPPDAIAISDKRLTNDEAEKLARLIVSLPELIELNVGQTHKSRYCRGRPPLPVKAERDSSIRVPVLYGLCLYHLYGAELAEAATAADRLMKLAQQSPIEATSSRLGGLMSSLPPS
jgi:hypothetical protein